MRETLFISHAAPEDNAFTQWLSLQLVGLGYKVWSDVLMLKGAEDWWPEIEIEIRENTVKFIVVLSSASNNKAGVLKELAVAQKVQNKLQDDHFILPVHIDTTLAYADINIELVRLNSLNFKQSWAEGLKDVLDFLTEHNVPKSVANFDKVNQFWQTVYLANNRPIDQEEVYDSSWFPVVETPEMLCFHKFDVASLKKTKNKVLPYPTTTYRDRLVTFAWGYDFIEELPNTERYDLKNTYKVAVKDILSGTYNSQFLPNWKGRRLLVELFNKGFDKALPNKGLQIKEMANSLSYWIEDGIIEKNKIGRIQLVGKQKEKKWHFGISGHVRLFPEPIFVIKSHIWFTNDGKKLIDSDSIQHSSRRKQGKNWWNNEWHTKLIAFMQYLGEEDQTVHIPLGSEELFKVAIQPIQFLSPVSYSDPGEEYLPKDLSINFWDDEDQDNELDSDTV